MESIVLYENVETTDWIEGLDKGTRLYYDFDKGLYVYHYERESTSKNKWCETKTFTSEDYFIRPETMVVKMRTGQFIAGPELGALESKCEDCKECNCEK